MGSDYPQAGKYPKKGLSIAVKKRFDMPGYALRHLLPHAEAFFERRRKERLNQTLFLRKSEDAYDSNKKAVYDV